MYLTLIIIKLFNVKTETRKTPGEEDWTQTRDGSWELNWIPGIGKKEYYSDSFFSKN